jgi:DNA primase small subunit
MDLKQVYFQHLYPRELIYEMMRTSPSLYRKVALSEGEIFWHDLDLLKEIRCEQEFHKKLLEHKSGQIHLGAIQSLREKTPLQKELVFDIDVTDFTRYCQCREKQVCLICWLHIEGASLLLNYILREQLGLQEKRILWVLSGKKGFHCLVNDWLHFSQQQRERLVKFIERKTIDSLREFIFSLEEEFIEKIMTIFTERVIIQRKLLDLPTFQQACLDLLLENYPGLFIVVKHQWNNCHTGVEKWQYLQQLEMRQSLQDIRPSLLVAVQCFYPRVDSKPMGLNNNFKAPFSLHPKTGKISLPVQLEKLMDYSLPFGQLGLAEACDYFARHTCEPPAMSEGKKLLKTWLSQF